jgi:hypothetical protein
MRSHVLSFSRAVDYAHLARSSRGVFVQIRLTANSVSTWDLDVRVDSASTFCVLGRQWADLLGLDWEGGSSLMISTAGGPFQARLHEITFDLLDWEWTASVAFAEWDSTPPSPARDVLGLNGFFDHFLVAIDDLEEIIYLEPRFLSEEVGTIPPLPSEAAR